MSAFDVAGAVVWTFLSVCLWIAISGRTKVKIDEETIMNGVVYALISSFAAIYCIARLFGAKVF